MFPVQNKKDQDKFTTLTPKVAGDAFTTLLYSNAVGLLIKRAISCTDPGASFLVLCMIGFLFFDWASRVWLPWQLPADERIARRINFIQLQKSFFEVTGVLCLAISFAMFFSVDGSNAVAAGHIQEASPMVLTTFSFSQVEFLFDKLFMSIYNMSSYSAFSLFLIITFCWNLLMLYVMEHMDYKTLWKAIWQGNALNSKDFETYAINLTKKIELIHDSINRLLEPTKLSTTPTKIHPYFLLGIFNTFSQIFAIHLTFTNIYTAAMLLLSSVFFNNMPLVNGDFVIKLFSSSTLSSCFASAGIGKSIPLS